MSIALFDMIRVSLQFDALGSLAMTIAFTFFVPITLFFIARVPPFFGFILMSPMFIAFAQAGYLGGTWVVAAVYIAFGILWAFVLRQGMNLQ